jgi:hypothetical protein
MAVRQRAAQPAGARRVEQYEHTGVTRPNNPPVGLVDSGTDPLPQERRTYAYDPHLDPQLAWAGKTGRTSFEVPTVSLHVHERIDPRTMIEAKRTPELERQRSRSGSEHPRMVGHRRTQFAIPGYGCTHDERG